jgi:hypothetical protein
MKNLVKNAIMALIVVIAFVGFIGSIGALEAESISMGQCTMQCIVCFALFFIAACSMKGDFDND